MSRSANFVAADLGASSGRLMVGQWDGRIFSLRQLHRFQNAGVSVLGDLYWNALGIWSHVQEGLAKYRSHFEESPQGIGVDAWGVDFALLDRAGRLLGNPRNYRDSRTDGMPERVFEKVDEGRLFTRTGVQTMQINTLFQLYSMAHSGDPQLQVADALLMIPDLFLYFLSGERSMEYSEASTTQMYSPACGDWAREMLNALGIPLKILSAVVEPGTVIAPVRPAVLQDARLSRGFPAIAVASHDTASAVAAIPNMDRSSAFISSGTWSLMGVEVDQPVTSKDAFRLGLTNEGGAGGSILLLRNLTGLWIIQECQRQWDKEGLESSWDDIISAAAQAKSCGSHFDPNAKQFQHPGDMPKFIHDYCRDTGQQPPQTVGETARCTFESLSLSYRLVLESLELVTGRHLEAIRVAGGGSLNAFLCQTIADACDRTVISGPVEASALGNIMLQAVATGHLSSVNQGRAAIAQSINCNEFTPHRSDAWDEAYSRFKAFL